jgi:hypothetical protein
MTTKTEVISGPRELAREPGMRLLSAAVNGSVGAASLPSVAPNFGLPVCVPVNQTKELRVGSRARRLLWLKSPYPEP